MKTRKITPIMSLMLMIAIVVVQFAIVPASAAVTTYTAGELIGEYEVIATSSTSDSIIYQADALDELAYVYDITLTAATDNSKPAFVARMYTQNQNERVVLQIYYNRIIFTNGSNNTTIYDTSRNNVEYSYLVKIINGYSYLYRKINDSGLGYELFIGPNTLQKAGNGKLKVEYSSSTNGSATWNTTVYKSTPPAATELLADMEVIAGGEAFTEINTNVVENYSVETDKAMLIKFDYNLTSENADAGVFVDDGTARCRIEVTPTALYYTSGATNAAASTELALTSELNKEYTVIVYVREDNSTIWYRKASDESEYTVLARGTGLPAQTNNRIRCIAYTDATATVTLYQRKYITANEFAKLTAGMEVIAGGEAFTAKDTNVVEKYGVATDKAMLIKFDYNLTSENGDVGVFVDDGTARCRIEVTPTVLYYTSGATNAAASTELALTSELNMDYTIYVYVNEDNSAIWYRKAADEEKYRYIANSTGLPAQTNNRIRCIAYTDAKATVTLYQKPIDIFFANSEGEVTETLSDVDSANLLLVSNGVVAGENRNYSMILAAYSENVLEGATMIPITVTKNCAITEKIKITDVVDTMDGIDKIRCYLWNDMLTPVADLTINAE